MKRTILEEARVVRSKNSGPYELTLDVMFKDKAAFDRARAAGVFTPALVARLYGVAETDVLGVTWFEPATAVKMTLRRRLASGSPGDTDIYGAQQHAPLLSLAWEG
ncbi:MAG TPA: DUF4387 domain-containing protein [Desulfobacterales bacterium]|nr:DUF4387 domain-containing protein [Desulfobacterales bacterium]